MCHSRPENGSEKKEVTLSNQKTVDNEMSQLVSLLSFWHDGKKTSKLGPIWGAKSKANWKTGMNWTEVDGTGVDWSGMDWMK